RRGTPSERASNRVDRLAEPPVDRSRHRAHLLTEVRVVRDRGVVPRNRVRRFQIAPDVVEEDPRRTEDEGLRAPRGPGTELPLTGAQNGREDPERLDRLVGPSGGVGGREPFAARGRREGGPERLAPLA